MKNGMDRIRKMSGVSNLVEEFTFVNFAKNVGANVAVEAATLVILSVVCVCGEKVIKAICEKRSEKAIPGEVISD